MLASASARLRTALATARVYDLFPLLVAELTAEQIEELGTLPLVSTLEEEAIGTFLLADAIPQIGADALHSAGTTGYGKTIAIVDSGVNGTIAALSNKVVAEGCFGNACYNGIEYGETGPGSGREAVGSQSGHGTNVAGAAAANSSYGDGVAKSATIISLNVASTTIGPDNVIYMSDVVDALEHAYSLRNTHTIAAVNLSLSVDESSLHAQTCDANYAALTGAINDLVDVGMVVVVSAGNHGYSSPDGNKSYAPACISSVLSVGGVTKQDSVWTDSVVGAHTRLLAVSGSGSNQDPNSWKLYVPGVGGNYIYGKGTSLAAPQVSGAIALLSYLSPTATPSQLADQLISTGVTKTAARAGTTYAVPRIDLEAAVATPSTPSYLTVTRGYCFGTNLTQWGSASGPVTHYVLEGSSSSYFTTKTIYWLIADSCG